MTRHLCQLRGGLVPPGYVKRRGQWVRPCSRGSGARWRHGWKVYRPQPARVRATWWRRVWCWLTEREVT